MINVEVKDILYTEVVGIAYKMIKTRQNLISANVHKIARVN
jgi:hypothetical protein